MRALKIVSPGPAYQLRLEDAPAPTPGPHDLLIKVAASGVNRADLYQAEGSYPPPPGASDIPGLEISGEITEIGREVRMHAVGNKVCALLRGGGQAEYAVASEWRALPVPRGLDMIQAAALPEAFFTAYFNLLELARLRPGETLLVHGGASGVGTAAIQLARRIGARVLTTAGSEEKAALCRRLGAELAINYRAEDFVAAVKEYTKGEGVHVLLDMVGGEYIQRNLKTLAFRGRMVSIAFIEGSEVTANFGALLMRHLTWTGSTLRGCDEERTHALAQALRNTVWPWLESGAVIPVIDTVLLLGEAKKAHDRMRAFQHAGKIVLKI